MTGSPAVSRDTTRLVAFSDVMFDHIRAADRVMLLVNTLLLMVVAFLPFATSVLADALRSGHGQRTAVAFYGIAFDVTALTFNAVWQYARRRRLVRRFQLARRCRDIGPALAGGSAGHDAEPAAPATRCTEPLRLHIESLRERSRDVGDADAEPAEDLDGHRARHGDDAREQVLGVGALRAEPVGDAAAVLERLLETWHDREAFLL
jgi:hypothetical protein